MEGKAPKDDLAGLGKAGVDLFVASEAAASKLRGMGYGLFVLGLLAALSGLKTGGTHGSPGPSVLIAVVLLGGFAGLFLVLAPFLRQLGRVVATLLDLVVVVRREQLAAKGDDGGEAKP